MSYALHSLGDFLFDVIWEERRLTGVLQVTFAPGRACPSRAAFYPMALFLTPEGIVPKPAEGVPRRAVVRRLTDLSKKMGTDWEDEGDALVMKLPASCK